VPCAIAEVHSSTLMEAAPRAGGGPGPNLAWTFFTPFDCYEVAPICAGLLMLDSVLALPQCLSARSLRRYAGMPSNLESGARDAVIVHTLG
jgi:hypothetical protein